jgi:hypothetical protein
LQNKSCDELSKAESLDKACPKTTTPTPPPGGGGDSGKLGDTCKCTDSNITPSTTGECAGDGSGCSQGLQCVYTSGGNGSATGACMAGRCCDQTSKCDDDPSLLKPCSQGTCGKVGLLGYYCKK